MTAGLPDTHPASFPKAFRRIRSFEFGDLDEIPETVFTLFVFPSGRSFLSVRAETDHEMDFK
jgi:hypothetical protein